MFRIPYQLIWPDSQTQRWLRVIQSYWQNHSWKYRNNFMSWIKNLYVHSVSHTDFKIFLSIYLNKRKRTFLWGHFHLRQHLILMLFSDNAAMNNDSNCRVSVQLWAELFYEKIIIIAVDRILIASLWVSSPLLAYSSNCQFIMFLK